MLAFERGDLAVPSTALVIGAQVHEEFLKWPDVKGHQTLKDEADAWTAKGLSLVEDLDGKYELVVVLPGKSKEATLVQLAQGICAARPGGTIICSMLNSAGGARFQKELKSVLGDVDSFQKNKCRVFWGEKSERLDERKLKSWHSLDQLSIVPGSSFQTRPGVFSANRIDPGSIFLALNLPKRIHGKVADLGAGWGYLSSEVLKRCPGVKQLDLYELDRLALDCAKLNLNDERLNFYWQDVAAGVPGNYDSIVMNPPFHSGIATNVSLGKRFLQSAYDALKKQGEMFIVANRQLPYEGELDELGLRWRKEAEDATYKLLFAVKR